MVETSEPVFPLFRRLSLGSNKVALGPQIWERMFLVRTQRELEVGVNPYVPDDETRSRFNEL